MSQAGQSNPNVIWRVVDGEAILLDTTTGYHFSFDSIGTEIWEGLQQGSTVADIAAGIASKYGMDESIVRRDVSEFLAELRSAKLWN
jgi:coenzyme PQQ synthesis protein D (PqqD)